MSNPNQKVWTDERGVLHIGNVVESFVPNSVPRYAVEGIPSIRAADEAGCPTAYLRFYEEGGRGEWFVLGLDPGGNAFCWVQSPWGEGVSDGTVDEFGSVDITALDYYRQVFGCGPIRLDEDFAPQPFSAEATYRGEHPIRGATP